MPLQAVFEAAGKTSTQLAYLSPAMLRKALRSAGNIIGSDEVAEVLSYAIKDGAFSELHDLHLILLKDGSVQQLKWGPSSSKFFVFADDTSEAFFGLMATNKHQLVEHSDAWTQLAR